LKTSDDYVTEPSWRRRCASKQ